MNQKRFIKRLEKDTVFERSHALVGDLELERSQKGSRIIQDGDVRDIHSAHRIELEDEDVIRMELVLLANRIDWNPNLWKLQGARSGTVK